MDDLKKLREIKEKINKKRPLVHCITNYVTVNDCANVLLAVGASPTMAHHPLEVSEVARESDALVLNLGATEFLDAMLLAGESAKEAKRPIVFDPVGAGFTKFRREQALELISRIKPDCIRGNLSEIYALALKSETARGVDAASEVVDYELLKSLSKEVNAIVVASGKIDYIAYNNEVYPIEGGSSLMTKVTGTGCISSALLGAFLAVDKSVESVECCLRMISQCAENAEKSTIKREGGTMTFRTLLIDEISK